MAEAAGETEAVFEGDRVMSTVTKGPTPALVKRHGGTAWALYTVAASVVLRFAIAAAELLWGAL